MLSSGRITIDELFAPKAALSGANARLFAGREEIVSRSAEAIGIPGAAGLIYGDRGVGKSSLGWQLFSIFSGDRALVEKYNLEDRAAAKCLWIEANTRISTIDDLLLQLLDEPKDYKYITLRSAFPEIFDDELKATIDASLKLNFGIAQLAVALKTDPRARQKQKLSGAIEELLKERGASPTDLFLKALQRAKSRSPNQEIIIFLDEFDRVKDKAGMGELIKSCGNAKFVVIGIADTPDELISDHMSVERKLLGSTIEVPPLGGEEISRIYKIAESLVESVKRYKQISFSDAFIEHAIRDCAGYPQIAQYLGYHAIRFANALEKARKHEVAISSKEYAKACRAILDPTNPSGPPSLNQRIKEAIGDVPSRARILQIIAEMDETWADINAVSERLAGREAANYFGNIDHLQEAEILVRSKDGTRVRFETPVIRFIVRIADREGILVQKITSKA